MHVPPPVRETARRRPFRRDWNQGGRGKPLLKPSMCSKRSRDTCCHSGARTNCKPSRRASLAAGTKSESPATRMMASAWRFSVIEAMSSPIRISTPFCRKAASKSSSESSWTARSPFKRRCWGSAFNIQERWLSWRTSPRRTAKLGRRCSASNSSFRKIAWGDRA